MLRVAKHGIRAVLGSACLLAGGLSAAELQMLRFLEAQTWVTEDTVSLPEVRVLLHNPQDVPIAFTLRFGEAPGSECPQLDSTPPAAYHQRFRKSGAEPYLSPKGIVPAGAWAFRHFSLGNLGLGAPCKVFFSVTEFGPGRHDGEPSGFVAIDVPASRPVPSSRVGPEKPGAFMLDAFVEKVPEPKEGELFFGHSPPVRYVTVLIRGPKLSQPLVAVTSTEFECRVGRVRFDANRSFERAISTGPAQMSRSGLAAFVQVVELLDGALDTQCSGRFTVSYRYPEFNWTEVGSIDVPLAAEGEYSYSSP